MYIENSSDDDVRLFRLVIGTLNRSWAYHPNISWDDACRYTIRADRAFKSVDIHQNKDRSCNAQLDIACFPIADLTNRQEI